MKILHLIANLAPRYGGPAKAGLEMASALARLGHEVTIFTSNQDGPTELDVPLDKPVYTNGVEIRYFPIQQPRYWRTSLPLAQALKHEITQYDIVHIHSIYLFPNLVAGYYCRKHNIPYIIRPHGTLDPYVYKRHRFRKSVMEFFFEDKNFKHAAAIHYTAEEEGTLASPYTFGRPGFVVPNGLDLSEYASLPEKGLFRKKYPELADKKVLLYFSRITFKKGMDILIKSFSKVLKTHSDAVLVITGPDDEGYSKKVKEWIDEENIADQVIFTGMLTGQDKLSVLRDADLFVLPSYTENFGIAVVEAMACGLPVVISDKVNIWREVTANHAGKAAPCDPDAFAARINELLADPDLCRIMGENGKQMVEDLYQWDNIGLSLEKQYQSILAGHRGTRSLKGTFIREEQKSVL